MPEIKKYLNRDGLEDYNSLLPHSAGEMQAYVNAWLDDHPEATTTVQDGSITAQKLAAKSVTRGKLADDVTNLLAGMMLTGEAQGEPITVVDAWGIEPITLTIEGKSTQAGIPTPENPIPIVSIEALAVSIHASADGTTDYGNWPVSVPLGQYILRSLPDGTKDALELTYLRPSEREGWAWYARELVQAVAEIDLGNLRTLYAGANNNIIYARWSDGENRAPARVAVGAKGVICPSFAAEGATSLAAARNKPANTIMLCQTGNVGVMVNVTTSDYPTVADFTAAFSGISAYYHLATPVTIQLDPIELPVLPAPTCTVSSDPTTGLKMSYMRNSNIVISDIEQAIADL